MQLRELLLDLANDLTAQCGASPSLNAAQNMRKAARDCPDFEVHVVKQRPDVEYAFPSTPKAMEMIKAFRMDPTLIKGTGQDGQILVADVRSVIEQAEHVL